MVAKIGFYTSDKVWMDDIMVQGDGEDKSLPQKNFVFVWFAKALELLGFKGNGGRIGSNVYRPGETMNEAESMIEYCFVQY